MEDKKFVDIPFTRMDIERGFREKDIYKHIDNAFFIRYSNPYKNVHRFDLWGKTNSGEIFFLTTLKNKNLLRRITCHDL